jgi:hypothetical protein
VGAKRRPLAGDQPTNQRGRRACRAAVSPILGEIRERLVEVLGHVYATRCAAEAGHAALGRRDRHKADGAVARHDHDGVVGGLADQVSEPGQGLCDGHRSHAFTLALTRSDGVKCVQRGLLVRDYILGSARARDWIN